MQIGSRWMHVYIVYRNVSEGCTMVAVVLSTVRGIGEAIDMESLELKLGLVAEVMANLNLKPLSQRFY